MDKKTDSSVDVEDQRKTLHTIEKLARRLPWIAVIGTLISMILIIIQAYLSS